MICLNAMLVAKTITIAAGQDVGNYYKIALKIKKKLPNYNVKILKTAGTVENMMLLSEKKADIALAQEDAKELTNTMFAKENKTVDDFANTIGALYKEKLHIIVHKNSKYKQISDLNNAVVSTGGKSSGTSVTAAYIESSHGINFRKIIDKPIKNSLEMLKRKQLDAVFVVTKSPFNVLNSYKNIRLLPIDNDKISNNFLKKDLLRKNKYTFLKKDIQAVSVNSFIMTHKSLKDKKVIAVLKELSTPIKLKQKKHRTSNQLIYVDKKILVKFSARYGYRGLVRYELYTQMVEQAQKEKTVKQFDMVNKFFNRINFMEDSVVWKKEDHWATPLQVLGTSAADSEDYALAKYFTLVKLGVDENRLKLVQYENGNKKENIVLLYYFKNKPMPIVLEHQKNKMYVLKSNTQIKEVTRIDKKSPWIEVFVINNEDILKDLNRVLETH